MDAKADLIVSRYGRAGIVEIVRRLSEGKQCATCATWSGLSLGASESPPAEDAVLLPSYEEVVADKQAFSRMTHGPSGDQPL